MSKQIKISSSSNTPSPTFVPSLNRKIRPLKHQFFTFESFYDYGSNYDLQVNQIFIKNPKWCHISLKLGRTGEYLKYQRIYRAKSLRLRSIHLESYSLDSQGCGDNMNRYYGELDAFTRAGHTLKKLSLSVTCENYQPRDYLYTKRGKLSIYIPLNKAQTYHHLKKFVKKQKYLDEFGLYVGSHGNSKWMCDILKYVEKTVKTLTIENMAIDNIFKKHEFPKLERLRFEYIQFYGSEDVFNFDILRRSLQNILALPLLSTLVFSQYQRYWFETRDQDGDEEVPRERLELVSAFWEELRIKLYDYKEKILKIKYHRKDDGKYEEKIEEFKRIFKGLPANQTFEYEVARVSRLTDEEVKAQGLEVATGVWGYQNWNHYWKGNRYLISLDKVEPLETMSL